MTTSPPSGLGSLMFKIRFLRTMLPKMSSHDLGIFYTSCLRVLLNETSSDDIEAIEKLYDKFGD